MSHHKRNFYEIKIILVWETQHALCRVKFTKLNSKRANKSYTVWCILRQLNILLKITCSLLFCNYMANPIHGHTLFSPIDYCFLHLNLFECFFLATVFFYLKQ